MIRVKGMVNPGALGTELKAAIMLYLYKIASETTGIIFYLLQTYIHTASMTTQATLQLGSIPSSLPKLVDPFPRSFWLPGMAEKLTL